MWQEVDIRYQLFCRGATQMKALLAFGGGPERRKNEPVDNRVK
jgi:hypothetical protein